VADSKGSSGGEGLSLQTLVIAAGASAAAAIVVSHLWSDGTVIAAAMTPVIVAIVKEMLARPMESELVKKPVKHVSRLASGRRPVAGRAATRARTGTQSPDPTSVPPPPPTAPRGLRPDPGAGNGDVAQGDPLLSPRRTYGRPRPRRRLHVKVAVVTGLLAFVIAALVLTVPELLFGGAVGAHQSTTFFGGGSSKSESKKDNGTGTSTKPDQGKPSDQQTTPATPPPTTGSGTPTTTTPAPTSPQQTTPQQTSPVPPVPSPPSP
jgi:hypothetical protein